MISKITSGLICLDWYDWNFLACNPAFTGVVVSGLICLDWYDWNQEYPLSIVLVESCRDWSVGIDLSGLIRLKLYHHLSKPSKFYCRDWSVWIDTIETMDHNIILRILIRSGLICLDWYDWNMCFFYRARNKCFCRDWSVWIDTIETGTSYETRVVPVLMSGLICLDWYDWNAVIAIIIYLWEIQVGIDLSGLIRLKLYETLSPTAGVKSRDWSVWIDTIETRLFVWF